ncbi:response regulator transcription factor [Vibrio sp. 99-70-13A1]|uniref:response regulator transcription factor n=1 Tax=Vibrio sp. 99-70-13A1 TaxID=2607601 RepID=UPI001493D2E3|nr:response regulator transcription factor [Vibrio sp. 99-70-13A1]NOH98975.1 response regulator transcription factor [Vibrio sp. 99-70-13A1]
MTKRILIIEDDQKLSAQISRFLEKHHYVVKTLTDGNQGLKIIGDYDPSIVILDLMMPEISGFEICRTIRPNFEGSILMLTGCDDDMDQVAGLEMGADGYLIKPIEPRVLLAHVRLLERKVLPRFTSGRRDHESESNLNLDREILEFNDLKIYLIRRDVVYKNQSIDLKPAEFDVLVVLAKNANQIVSRDFILNELRGIEYDGLDRSVDVKIAALRKKLSVDNDTLKLKKIITVRSKGYCFVGDAW